MFGIRISLHTRSKTKTTANGRKVDIASTLPPFFYFLELMDIQYIDVF